MGINQSTPGELFVYECWGSRAPRVEPCFEGYLGLWPVPPFYYLFADRQVLSLVTGWLLGQPDWTLRDTYTLDYDQWQQGGHESCDIGSFRIVKQESSENPWDPDRIIRLQPGLVFGSGLHPATQACLQVIDRYEHQFRGAKVIDLGTGTGLLAIACGRLGASRVVAVDYNPMAIRETRANIVLNGLEGVIQPVLALGLTAFTTAADWLIMNLEYPALTQVLRDGRWSSYPKVLVSGFLLAQWEELQEFIPHGHRLDFWFDWQGWGAGVFINGAGGSVKNPGIISG
jgi:ribosomal protein L11 methyltransferase